MGIARGGGESAVADDEGFESTKLAEVGHGGRSLVLLGDGRLEWQKASIEGDERSLGGPATVGEAISLYAELLLEGWTEKARQMEEGREVVAFEGVDDPRELLRDPQSFTIEEARAQAAAEVLSASLEALFALPENEGLGGPAARLYAEIEEAAASYPAAVTRLLYDAHRQLRGWPM
jgi:hypothetical protein